MLCLDLDVCYYTFSETSCKVLDINQMSVCYVIYVVCLLIHALELCLKSLTRSVYDFLWPLPLPLNLRVQKFTILDRLLFLFQLAFEVSFRSYKELTTFLARLLRCNCHYQTSFVWPFFSKPYVFSGKSRKENYLQHVEHISSHFPPRMVDIYPNPFKAPRSSFCHTGGLLCRWI